MSDYIKRENAIEKLEFHIPLDLLDDIKDIPSEDVAPVRHGRWKAYKTDVAGRGFFYCTACHADVYDTSAYCPSCGAKMDCKCSSNK